MYSCFRFDLLRVVSVDLWLEVWTLPVVLLFFRLAEDPDADPVAEEVLLALPVPLPVAIPAAELDSVV